MMKNKTLNVTLLGLMFVAGCIRQDENQTTQSTPEPGASSPAIDPNVILSVEPEGAQGVIAVREAAKDGDEILITGRIGGEVKPFVDGRVAFRIVDDSLNACSDIPGDQCETPWDYCCETEKLPGAMALVKFVDEEGKPLEGNAKELLNVSELTTVVVKGKAQRLDGNLTVLAESIFVKK